MTEKIGTVRAEVIEKIKAEIIEKTGRIETSGKIVIIQIEMTEDRAAITERIEMLKKVIEDRMVIIEMVKEMTEGRAAITERITEAVVHRAVIIRTAAITKTERIMDVEETAEEILWIKRSKRQDQILLK